jgi:CBS domain containing-hemolysin-like protein
MPDAVAQPVTINWLGVVLQSALILVLAVVSAAFSGSEAALFSQTAIQLQHDETSPNPLRRLAASLMRDAKKTLMVILLGNTAVNTLLFAISYVLFESLGDRLGDWVGYVGGFAVVLLVITVGETIPKVLGVALSDRLVPYAALFVRSIGVVLGPVGRGLDVLLIEPLSRVLFGRRAADDEDEEQGISTTELKVLLEMSRRGGVIDPVEDSFLREVIDLHDIRARDVMTPRIEVVLFDINGSSTALRERMRQTKRTKVPVYEGSIDNIVGLVYAKVLFFQPQKSLRELATPVRFVPEMISGEQLLEHFRKTKSQVAIAVDEFGGMAGLVTLEDVLEHIVGDIHDQEDAAAPPEIEQISDSEYEVDGRLSVKYWSQSFGQIHIPERVATVGGLITARLGRPARVGDELRLGNLRLRVVRMAGRRILRIRVTLRGPGMAGAAAVAPEAGALS